MADYVRLTGTPHYIGAASDTKPTSCPSGSRCYEHDTKKWYITYNGGTNWVEMQDLDAIVLGATADGTYIGDIKFGEGLPANSGVDIGDVTLNAGTAAFGKLSANNGVDIGDVGIERVNLTSVTATITQDDATGLSAEIDLGGSSMQTILMPAAWTAASLTFQVFEATGGTYRNLYDDSGTEVTVTTAASRAIPMPSELAGTRFIKLRSGTSGTPVTQLSANKIITVLLKG